MYCFKIKKNINNTIKSIFITAMETIFNDIKNINIVDDI